MGEGKGHHGDWWTLTLSDKVPQSCMMLRDSMDSGTQKVPVRNLQKTRR